MTNNDELALKLRAAAEQAKSAMDRYDAGEVDGGEAMELMGDFTDVVLPANILALLAERDADKKRIADLSALLGNAHAFIENTEAFGREAATGIIKCGDAEWNIDNSKAALSEGGIKLEVGE